MRVKIKNIIPTILLLAVYMISYIGIEVHECSAEGTKEVVAVLGCECAHPHDEHHDDNCHHDGGCHHTDGCCHTSIYSISEADEGGGNDALHNYTPDFSTILLSDIYNLEPVELKYSQDIYYSIPIIPKVVKRLDVLRL